jgi:hypothetical protein
MPPEQALVQVILLLAKLDSQQLLRVIRCAEHLLDEHAQQLSLLKDYGCTNDSPSVD